MIKTTPFPNFSMSVSPYLDLLNRVMSIYTTQLNVELNRMHALMRAAQSTYTHSRSRSTSYTTGFTPPRFNFESNNQTSRIVSNIRDQLSQVEEVFDEDGPFSEYGSTFESVNPTCALIRNSITICHQMKVKADEDDVESKKMGFFQQLFNQNNLTYDTASIEKTLKMLESCLKMLEGIYGSTKEIVPEHKADETGKKREGIWIDTSRARVVKNDRVMSIAMSYESQYTLTLIICIQTRLEAIVRSCVF